MLFSYRRLRWSAISLLVVCWILLTPATRRMLDQTLVRHMLGPQVSVGELVFHSQKSIVEARDLKWTVQRGPKSVQLTVPRGWIAVDKMGLVDRNSRFPMVVLKQVDLQLEQAKPIDAGLLIHWKHRLAQQVSQLDWKQIHAPLGCLTASQTVRQSFADRIERWRERSREILNEAEQLERQSSSMDNPLRFEISLKEKLARIQELTTEQRLLVQQFDTLDGQLQAETQRLHTLYQQDHLHFAGLVIGNPDQPVPNLEMDRLCLDVAQDLGQAFWHRIAPYGEVLDHLANAASLPQRADFDIDVRSDRFGNQRVALNQWKGSGTFRCGLIEAPFQANGDWILTQSLLAPPTLAFMWDATFKDEMGQVNAHAELNTHNSPATHLKLQHRQSPAAAPAAPSGLVDDSKSASDIDHQPYYSEVNLKSDLGQLSGELALLGDALLWLGADPLPAPAAGVTQSQPQPLTFELEGNWSQMQLKPVGTIPAWLVGALAAEANHHLHLAAATQQSQLEQAFLTEIAQLQVLVNTAVDQARSLNVVHERQLLATQQQLQRQIDQIDGLEYARRPGAVIR